MKYSRSNSGILRDVVNDTISQSVEFIQLYLNNLGLMEDRLERLSKLLSGARD